MADTGTGWERNRRVHFDEIVMDYDKIRPKYPDKLFEDVINYSGLGKGKKALEIGAGTGRATSPFLNAGYHVTAVEIGESMANFLVERFKEYGGFHVIVSAFEDTELEEGSYDLIYAASAFHWVDAEIGCPKVFRLLRNGGTCALFRYNFNVVPTEDEEIDKEIRDVYEQYYYSYYESEKRPVRITHELLETPTKIKNGYGFEDLKGYGFIDISMKLYDVTLTYSADEYIKLLDTMSDHRALPDDNRVALYAGINETIQKHGGCHKVDCAFQLYMGRKL